MWTIYKVSNPGGISIKPWQNMYKVSIPRRNIYPGGIFIKSVNPVGIFINSVNQGGILKPLNPGGISIKSVNPVVIFIKSVNPWFTGFINITPGSKHLMRPSLNVYKVGVTINENKDVEMLFFNML